ncbi:NAD(P)H-dependent oxidoreductase [Candidatus Woesearchaeota archaeon]|jgi:NAD(P)H dehydrogenase (quinone)|nr:NAD(P)H-dependent oxidoreductase [Candidatus Woesearchaeota archaeon]
MKTLIIFAHPNTKGHSKTILTEIKKYFKSHKLEYELLDLHKIKYDPVLHEEEHYTAGNRNITKQNKEFQQKISDSNNLIFIYPIWWGTMPAILKGFFDKILTPRFAYEYKNKIPTGLLKGKQATIFMTTGAKRWMTRIFMGDRSKKHIESDILRFCGIKSKTYYIDNCTKLTEDQENKIKTIVKKGLNKLYNT